MITNPIKRLLHAILLGCAALPSCNPLSSVPPETVNAIASAGGGCVAVESIIMGKGVFMVGSADKGSLKNGEVTVSANCGGITIKNGVPPVPGK